LKNTTLNEVFKRLNFYKKKMNMQVSKEFQTGQMRSLKNVNGDDVDLYVPRKCSATSRLLHPKDRSSIQLNFPKVDANGRVVPDEFEDSVAMSGYIRNKARSDLEIEKLLIAKGLYPVAD